MYSWKRNRRLIQGAVLGAAGAAAAYGWWTFSKEEGSGSTSFVDSLRACTDGVSHTASLKISSWLGARQPEPDTEAGVEAVQQDATTEFDDNIQRYFNSVQQITDTQTLPDWVQRLYDRLVVWTDFDAVKAALKGLQSSSGAEATQHKVALWQQLALLSFTRTLASCWLLPLLDLLLRVKLNILGRHLYLESTLEALQPARQWKLQFPGSGKQQQRAGALPPKLSNRAQEMYLDSASFFPEVGAKLVVDQMSEAVAASISAIELKAVLAPSELVQLMSSIHLRLDHHFSGTDWVSVLAGPDLPTPTTHAMPDGAVASVHPLEAAMVDEMNAEVRKVLSSERFQGALVHAVKYAAKEAADAMVAKFAAVGSSREAALAGSREGGGGLQFPKVVGIVAASCEAMFDPLGRIRKGMANLAPVQSLCATVYACGPLF